MKRRTEILVEIEREITISTSGSNRSWCVTCGKQVQMLPAGEAAQMLRTDESVIYRLAELGELHFAATKDGMLLVCPDSLTNLRNDEHPRPSQNLLNGRTSSVSDGSMVTEGEVSAD